MGIGEVGERLRRSTVHIRSSNRRGQSAGSGVIWNENGLIVTNAHVLGGGDYSAELWDGRTFPAEVVDRDDPRDLAKLKLSTGGLQALGIRPAPPRPGELVVAVGNPLGFTGALTTGIVHTVGAVPGLGRKLWVQAAVRLAPGNSGGPLADAAGLMVGVNTMIVSGGIALAIPSAAAEDFMNHGAHPRLGVTIQPVRLPKRRLGLLLTQIEPASAAERASLMIGDVLVAANGADFEGPGDLADSIEEARAAALHLRFLRGDRSREREVAISFERSRREAA